jgi:hypothetical protein
MPHGPTDPGFAPDDLTDARRRRDWKTRYPDPEAQKAIRFEAIYVFVLFALCPPLLILIWYAAHVWFRSASDPSFASATRYAYGWIAGLLGGTLFSLKWLYHSVAHAIWNIDRRLWRLFSPHLSAALAFIFICLIDSRIVAVFDPASLNTPSTIVSIGFLVGYFSDTALAKLSDVAYSLFGTTEHSKSGITEHSKKDGDDTTIENSAKSPEHPE